MYSDFVQLVIYCAINLSALLPSFRICSYILLPEIIEKKQYKAEEKNIVRMHSPLGTENMDNMFNTRFVKLNNAIQVFRHVVSRA